MSKYKFKGMEKEIIAKKIGLLMDRRHMSAKELCNECGIYGNLSKGGCELSEDYLNML
jgi:hypothetical protein